MPLQPMTAQGVEETHPNPRTLPLGHHHQPACPRLDESRPGRERDVGHRLSVDPANIVGGSDHRRQLQIVMWLKQGIVALLSLADLKLKAWSWPKPPPMEFAGTG